MKGKPMDNMKPQKPVHPLHKASEKEHQGYQAAAEKWMSVVQLMPTAPPPDAPPPAQAGTS